MGLELKAFIEPQSGNPPPAILLLHLNHCVPEAIHGDHIRQQLALQHGRFAELFAHIGQRRQILHEGITEQSAQRHHEGDPGRQAHVAGQFPPLLHMLGGPEKVPIGGQDFGKHIVKKEADIGPLQHLGGLDESQRIEKM